MAKQYNLKVQIEAESSLQDEIAKLEQIKKLVKDIEGKLNITADHDKAALAEMIAKMDLLTKAFEKQKKIVEEKTEADKEAEKITKQLSASTDEEVKGKIRYQQATQNQKKILRDLLILEDKEAGTLEKLAAANRRLTAERAKLNLETAQGKTRLVQINAELDKNNAIIKDSNDALGKQRLNIGNYKSALEGLPGPLGQAAQGVSGLGQQFKALLANPIVLLIAAITAAIYGLFKAFTSTDSGATEFAARMEQVSAVIDVVRMRAASLAEGILNVFSGNWKEAADNFSQTFEGIGKQLKSAADAAYEYIHALDELEDAENNYISERADNANKIARLEFLAADRSKPIAERRAALKEAIRLSEEESKWDFDHKKKLLEVEAQYLAEKNNLTKQQVLDFIKLSIEEQKLATGAIALARNSNEEKFKQLEEHYRDMVNADTKFFEENKKNNSKLSAFNEEIAAAEKKRREEELRAKETAYKRQDDLEDARLKRLKEVRDAEAKAAADRKKELEDEAKLEADMLANVLRVGKRYVSEKKEGKKKEKEEEKKLQQEFLEEQIRTADVAANALNEALDKQSEKKIKALNEESISLDKNLARQEARAEQGLSNTLELEQRKQAELEIEKEKQLKADARRQKMMTYWNLVSSYAKDPNVKPDQAALRAAKDIVIAEGITMAFAAKGGIAGEVKDTTTLLSDNLTKSHGSAGDVLTVLDPREGILTAKEMEKLGRDGFFGLKAMLNNPMNDDIMFPKVPVFAPVAVQNNNKDVVKKLDELSEIIRNKPVSNARFDEFGNAITEDINNGIKHIKKVMRKKPGFYR